MTDCIKTTALRAGRAIPAVLAVMLCHGITPARAASPDPMEVPGSAAPVVPDGGTSFDLPLPEEKTCSPKPVYPLPHTNALDRAQRWISDRVINTVDAFDRFVGKESMSCEEKDCEAVIELSAKIEISEPSKIEASPHFSAHLVLPRLQNRVKVVFDQFVDDDKSLPPLGEDKDERQYAGIRVALTPAEDRWQLDLDGGFKINHGLIPFAAIEAYRNLDVYGWILQFKEAAAWFGDDGFKLYSQIKWTHPIVNRWFFESSTRLTWREDENGLTLAQSFLNFRRSMTREKTYLGIGFGAVGVNHPAHVIDKYRAAIVYERRIFRPWIVLEINPAIEFPRDRDYSFTPSLTFKFSLLFGRVNGNRPYFYF